MLLYVDDILIASTNKAEIQGIKDTLNSEFDMNDFGKAKRIIGLDITRNRAASKLSLCQKACLDKVLCRFNMHKAKTASTSIGKHF